MKILIEGEPARYDRYSPHLEIQKTAEVVFVPRGADQETMLKKRMGRGSAVCGRHLPGGWGSDPEDEEFENDPLRRSGI